MILTCTLVAGFVEKQHSWIGILSSNSDASIAALIDDAMKFSFQVSDIL